MYQQTLGRFLSRDPLAENGMDVMTDTGFYGERLAAMRANPWYYGGNWEHPYVYARNNSVQYIDPSGLFGICVFKGSVGKLYIDCSCRDILKIWIIDEESAPASGAECGKWLDVDGYVINGQLYKVDGSTCCTIKCTKTPAGPGKGTATLTCVVNLLARCLGKKGTYPVPNGTFGGPPKEPPPGSTPPVVK